MGKSSMWWDAMRYYPLDIKKRCIYNDIYRERECVNAGNITARKSGYDMIYLISIDIMGYVSSTGCF